MKEKVELSFFVCDMVVNLENSKASIKKYNSKEFAENLEGIEFCKIIEYRTKYQKRMYICIVAA